MKINHLTLTRENEITRAALIFPLISLRDKFVRILVNLVSDWLAQIISTKMKCRLRYSVQVKNLKNKTISDDKEAKNSISTLTSTLYSLCNAIKKCFQSRKWVECT